MSNSANKLRILCFASLFAALTCIGTFIAVPLPIGYFNLGDVFILVGAFLLGPVWSAVAAGLGAALADVFMGFAIYAPATFVIKAAVAAIGATLFTLAAKNSKTKTLGFFHALFSALIAECAMVGGYFLYESLVLGYGIGATASLLGNALQGVCGALGSAAICRIIGKYNFFKLNK